MRFLPAVVAAAAALLPAAALAIPPLMGPPPPPPPPRLVVAISVDQLSSDLFEEYRPMFTAGFRRLADGGTLFRNGYQGHNSTETCPGHSTIMTGSRPSRTGIIANHWFDPSQKRSDKGVYCAEDERVPGSSTTAFTVSPTHLRVPTLGDRLKAISPASRNVAVAGKDRSAVMMSGHKADQRWYWDCKKFTSDLKGVAAPRSVASTNLAVARMIAAPSAPLVAPPLCEAKSRVVPIQGGSPPVGAGRFARAAGDVSGFRVNPAFDGATLALAAALVGEMQLGKGAATTDILSIGLAATDYVGHKYGTAGAEMCLQLLSLDRDLGSFLAVLDRSGVDYVLMLTSDHGGDDAPERLREQGVPEAARVDPALNSGAVGKAIATRLGLPGQVLYGDSAFGDIYVERTLSSGRRAQVLAQAIATYRAHPQVEAVFTKEQLARTPSPTTAPDRWTVIERARASFDAERSGDFLVILKRHVTPIADTRTYIATHGSPWDYDRRVPVLFWRKGFIAGANRDEPIETADIMPTLAAMLGMRVDRSGIDGECLRIGGIACPR